MLEKENDLCATKDSQYRLSRLIIDDIKASSIRDDFAHAADLRRVLQHFLEHHAGATA